MGVFDGYTEGRVNKLGMLDGASEGLGTTTVALVGCADTLGNFDDGYVEGRSDNEGTLESADGLDEGLGLFLELFDFGDFEGERDG